MDNSTQKKWWPALGFFLAILAGCGGLSVKNAEVNDLSWLKGEWKGGNDQTNVHSRYTQLSSNSISGSSYIMQGGDTTGIRAVRIANTEGKVILTLRTEQNRKPVGYELRDIAERKAVFKNEEANSPKTITYQKGKDTLTTKWQSPKGTTTYRLVKE